MMTTWLYSKRNLVNLPTSKTFDVCLSLKYLGNPPVTYINASPIRFANIKQEFIASIAPKPNSFENFWEMIIEKRVSVIVMLTDLQEGGKRKSDQYWPDREDETRDIGSGISLKHVTSEYQGVFITRKVYLLIFLWLQKNV